MKPKKEITYTKGMAHLHPLHSLADEIAGIIYDYEIKYEQRCHCCGMSRYVQNREELVARLLGDYWPAELPKPDPDSYEPAGGWTKFKDRL